MTDMREHEMEKMNQKKDGPGTLRLSKRLNLVASFVPEGSRIADIGTDHGYIPIYLAQTGKTRSALAMDVRKEPLARAQAHIEEFWKNGGGSITTRLSDGLKELRPGEVDTVIIAGMGGELEIRILEEGKRLWNDIKRWVLSPQSDLDKVRRYLAANGFSIEKEAMVKDQGKFYTVMLVVRGHMEYENQAQYLYGKKLIEQKNSVLKEYLLRERSRVEGILAGLKAADAGKPPLTPAQEKAIKQLSDELFWIKEAQDEMQ